MKLSKERQDLVESRLKRKFSELTPRYSSEIEEFKYLPLSTVAFKTKVNNRHGDHMQEMADLMVQAYLDAYRDEDSLPDDNDIAEIVNKISLYLNNETNACALKLPEFSGLSTEMSGILSRIKTNADSALRDTVKEAKLKSKKEEAKKMEQQLLIEKEKQRYRLLREIYNQASGSSSHLLSMEQLQKEAGLTKNELYQLAGYLKDEGLIIYPTLGTVSITHYGIKEIEASMKNPNNPTEHFTPAVIQHFHGTVYAVQTGGQQNTQNVQVNINPGFNEAISKLTELINNSTASGLQKEEAIEALERLPKLAQKEKSPDVLEAAKKRLDLVKTTLEVSANLVQMAMPYLNYLYQWFQG